MDEDIFDKIMNLPVLNIFHDFYIRNKEVLLYLFFGGLSFLVNVGIFTFCNKVFSMNELIANVISWFLTVLFVYFTNKLWVFKVDINTRKELFKQIIAFFAGRLGTLVVEEILLLIFITLLNFDSLIVKIVAQIIVIILNYIVSKLFVFVK